MAKLFCSNCGPVRVTITRTDAPDLDRLPAGPVPGSRCGSCGRGLWAGSPTGLEDVPVPLLLGGAIAIVIVVALFVAFQMMR